MLRIKAQQRKQRAAEAKVEESERKLIEFAQRLSARKTKVIICCFVYPKDIKNPKDLKKITK